MPDAPSSAAAEYVLAAPRGKVSAIAGVDSESLRAALDAFEPNPDGPRALMLRIAPAPSVEAIVDSFVAALAETARQLWPLWCTDRPFPAVRDDPLGRLAVGLAARDLARAIPGVSSAWLEAAARAALAGRAPRVNGALPAIEVAQLALAINRAGLVVVADVEAARDGPHAAAMAHALEWIARHIDGAVIAWFARFPSAASAFDRILYGARTFAAPTVVAPDAEPAVEDAGPWLAPWRGLPHPGSEIEQKLAKALGADAELAPLFVFNQGVDTVRGTRPKVDLVWAAGRLAIEIDGYGSHGNRIAFMQDRHRDYELTLSGYTVSRLTNDEIAQDVEKAIEKIRDLVTYCRERSRAET